MCPRPAFHKKMDGKLPSTQYVMIAQRFDLQAPANLWLLQELVPKDSAWLTFQDT